ncbi:MAPEG family protein [Limnohabitans sp. Rim8]|uniref:MAPEG family protein n=1 Tax=Limnohabitans sp. Rim8 TaxID=1100718 RepID=UPI0025FBBC16|nr:MAPEG family protein [Limnohabitans sp. Rim8]
MMISYGALLVAGLMPVVCAGIAKSGFKGYDNSDPRAWLAQQTGFRARANAAQANCFEAFPFFAVGVILALLTGVAPQLVDTLSLFFLVMRVAYVFFYITDKAKWRTMVWSAAYLTVVAFYALAMLNLQMD